MAPLWERLVTGPLMRRPHMYQTRPSHGCRTRHQQCCSTSILKDNDNTGCTNVENPCKYSARMEDKTTSAVIHCCYLHCFRKSVPNCFQSTSQMSFSLNKHLCLLWVDLELDTAGGHQSVDPGQGIVDGVVALKETCWGCLRSDSCSVCCLVKTNRIFTSPGARGNMEWGWDHNSKPGESLSYWLDALIS